MGTNDFKARFRPSATGIAENIARLQDCVRVNGGGRAAPLGLFDAMADVAKLRIVAVFDAGKFVTGSTADPVHQDCDSRILLGRALTSWLKK